MLQILIGAGIVIFAIGLLYVLGFFNPVFGDKDDRQKITFTDRVLIGTVNLLLLIISGVILYVLFNLGGFVLTTFQL